MTCDDFVDCMAEASGRDLEQFRRWYEQAGTPEIAFDEHYDAQSHRYALTLRQCKPAKSKGGQRPPLVIPVATGLLVNGSPLSLGDGTTCILELVEPEQTFYFEDVPEKPREKPARELQHVNFWADEEKAALSCCSLQRLQPCRQKAISCVRRKFAFAKALKKHEEAHEKRLR